ncbi:MAG TPA: hypothetical protein VF840_00715 [Terriglobales bacterium]
MRLPLAAVVLALALPMVAHAQTSTCVDASTLQEKHQRGGIVGGAQKVMRRPSTTVDAPGTNVCPLTAREKLMVWVQRSYSPANLLAAGVNAAVWQATDDDPRGYGQGWEAYGARYGASLATTESTRFFQSFLLPSILKEDPRYFRKGQGGFGNRFAYSISRVLVTRTDAGRQSFNFSAVGGAFAGAALSNTYLPDVDRDAGRTAVSAGLSLANTAGWHLLSEFGPDIWHKLRGKKKN